MKRMKKLLSILLCVATVVAYMPATTLTVSAEVQPTTGQNPPTVEKVLTSNGDGTYNLALSVTGTADSTTRSTKADVIIIFDKSGSMSTNATGATRLSVAQTATKDLIDQLLGNNTTSDPDKVHVGLVSFSNIASVDNKSLTNNAAELKSKVDSYKADGGTNWEDAFQKAATMSTRDDAAKYIIFVSDGNPTFRNTQGGEYKTGKGGKQEWKDWDDKYDSYQHAYGVWGTGSDSDATTVSHCYDMAKDDAKALVDAGYSFYGIGAFGSVDRMKNIVKDAYGGTAPDGHYYAASDKAALKAAFDKIVRDITNSFDYEAVSITDGITSLTSMVNVSGTPGDYTYTKTAPNGTPQTWTDAPEATYQNGTVTWDLGDDFKLENQVKYTVNFTVWPSQRAYDIATAVANGTIKYGDTTTPVNGAAVTAAEWSQIDESTNSLKTNTTATVDYVAKRIDDGQVVSEDHGPVAIDPPDPVPLTTSKLKVKKNWSDVISDGEDRPTEVTLKVTQDGNEFAELTLSDANNWEQEITIAPGILVNANQHGAGADGVLESGHTYTVTEPGIENHYELTTEIIQPMVNGKTNPTPESDLIDKISGKVWEDGTATLSATNVVKSGINITKKVSGDSEDTNKFKFTIKLKDKNGNAIGTPSPAESGDLGYRILEDGKVSVKGELKADGTTIEINQNQWIRIVNVPAGTSYEVTEAEAAGYKTTSENAKGTVSKGDSVVVVSFINEKQYSDDDVTPATVDMNKVDSITGDPIKATERNHAEFTVFKDGKTIGKTYFANGKIAFDFTEEGTYNVKETTAPANYQLNKTEFTVVVTKERATPFQTLDEKTNTWTKHYVLVAKNSDGEEISSITVKEDPTAKDVTLTKTDAATGTPLKGAAFELKNNVKTYTSTDNGDGKYTFKDVISGSYTLKETTAPAGYGKANDQTVTIDTDDSRTLSLTVQDPQKKAKVTVTKKDATKQDKLLAGAVFTLEGTASDGKAVNTTATTNANGVAEFTDVPFGTYTLKETKAPKGYNITYTPQDVVINADNVDSEFSYVALDGQKTGEITVTKKDKTTNDLLKGAVFTLEGTSEAGDTVKVTSTDNGDGTYKIANVPFGTYTVTETTAPTGYTVSFEPAEAVINADNVEEGLTFTAVDTEKTGTVEVTKKDATTGKKLAGAEFTLTGTNSAGEAVELTATTNEKGVATFNDVAFGSYRLTETKAPTGYGITYGGEDVTIDASNVETTKEIVVEDGQRTGTIKVTKTDATTKEKLAGATFTLTGKTEGGTAVSKTATDKGDGTYVFESVAFGTYELEETVAPTGYDIAFNKQTVTVNAGNVETAIEIAAVDTEKTGTVEVTKKDATTKKLLKGAEFTLTGKTIDNKDYSETITTDANGIASFENVPFGSYKLTETKAPKGYTIADAWKAPGQDVTVSAANVETKQEIAVEDGQKTGTITVTKLDATTEAKLTGATFNLKGTSEANSDVNVTATDNGDGTYTFAEVPFGKYHVSETAAPTGYDIEFAGEDVTINAENVEEALTYTVKDPEKTGTIKVTKTDATTGAVLEGAEFTLTGKNSAGKDVTVKETTGTDGIATFANVAFGTYNLTETKAPAGYEITYAGEDITVNAGNVTTTKEITVTDDQKTGTITVTKKDATTKAALTGAEFKLTGKNSTGKDVDVTATDNGDGTYTFAKVPFGSYELTETKAPTGYENTFEAKKITINATNVTEEQTVNVEDPEKTGTIKVTKTDATTGAVLEGAEFTLTGKNSAGEAVEVKKTTGADGVAEFANVAFGSYRLTETKAPEGYEITYKGEDVTVNAANVSTTKTITVADGQEAGTILVEKIDNQTKKALAGATFTLTGTTTGKTEVTKTATDNGDGTYTFESVPFGTYTVTETKAPAGYTADFAPKTVEVNAKNVGEVIKVNAADNEKTGTITVTKSDKQVAGRTLAGAEFQIEGKTAAGETVKTTATTNAQGVATFNNVAFGTYELTETKAPKGYKITFEGKSVTVDASTVTQT